LEDWNVQVSQQVLEWQAEARQEAWQEGWLEGNILQCRVMLIRLLEARFGSPVAANLASEITVQRDLAVLDRWFDSAVNVPSLDAFCATLHIERSGKDPHGPVS
jgi:hypothetical protein